MNWSWKAFWMIIMVILLAFVLSCAGCLVCTGAMIAISQTQNSAR